MSSHFISLAQASAMTSLYRLKKEDILLPEFRGQDLLLNSETFDRAAFDIILGRTEAKGLRFYFGMETNLQIRIIAVATDENNEDITGSDVNNAEPNGGGFILEFGIKCPPTCSPPGPLG